MGPEPPEPLSAEQLAEIEANRPLTRKELRAARKQRKAEREARLEQDKRARSQPPDPASTAPAARRQSRLPSGSRPRTASQDAVEVKEKGRSLARRLREVAHAEVKAEVRTDLRTHVPLNPQPQTPASGLRAALPPPALSAGGHCSIQDRGTQNDCAVHPRPGGGALRRQPGLPAVPLCAPSLSALRSVLQHQLPLVRRPTRQRTDCRGQPHPHVGHVVPPSVFTPLSSYLSGSFSFVAFRISASRFGPRLFIPAARRFTYPEDLPDKHLCLMKENLDWYNDTPFNQQVVPNPE